MATSGKSLFLLLKVSGALLRFLGYIFGAFLAFVAGQGKAQVSVAFIVLNITLPSPCSDMGMMSILGFFFFSTGSKLWLTYSQHQHVTQS